MLLKMSYNESFYIIMSSSIIFFPIFLQTLILLKGRKGVKQEKKVKKFQGEYEKKKKRILMSKPILEKVVMKL